MEAALDEIIAGLLCTDTKRIHNCTAALRKAFENPEALPVLCQMLVSTRETQIRQFAVVLMNKRLAKLRHWQMVPPEHQAGIKACVLQALRREKEKSVKNAIALLIGTLVRHEADKKDSWLAQLLSFIFERCSMDDPKESELGSSIFASLTDSAPDQLISQMSEICQLFSSVLIAAQSNGDMATLTIANMMQGMCSLIPFIVGHTMAEQTVSRVVPLMLAALQAFVQKGVLTEFTTAFEIMDSVAEYVPKLLNNYLKMLVDFCLATLSNKQIDDQIRVVVVTFVGRIVRVKKKAIVKQKLLDLILVTVFEMTCSELGNDDEDDYFSGTSNTPVTAATQTFDVMALQLSPEKLIPPLLQILEPALQSPDPLRRRAAFMAMAVSSEGCSEAIKKKYLEIMLNIIKSGIIDQDPAVRNAAFFALGQFSEFMQPEIAKFASQILPVLFEFLHQLVVELKMGQPEPTHMDRMFYALEVFCENLEEEIVPHLPVLMDRLFECMDQQNSIHIRQLALSTISSVATASKTNLVPYFSQIVEILKIYLLNECDESLNELRIQAIDTLASITRTVGKENFIHLAQDTMNYCMNMLELGPDDPDLRRAIYALIGGLSVVVTSDMNTFFPKVIERMIQTVVSTEDALVKLREDSPTGGLLTEIDLGNTDDEDDDDDDIGEYQVENDYVYEKEEAILTLKEFAVNSRNAFFPYLTMVFEEVYKTIDHCQDVIRKAAIEALCAFVICLHKMNDGDGVKRACSILIPKFIYLVKNDEEQAVVWQILDELGELFKAVKTSALPTPDLAESVVACIKDVLLNNTACQFNEPSGGGDEEEADESEYDEALIESGGNLVAMIGHALQPETYSLYFGRLYNFFLTKLAKAKKKDDPDQRSFIYGVLAECFQSLGLCVVTYFDWLCPVLLVGTTDSYAKARQNSYFGLGELVYHAEEKSFDSFGVILQALSDAIAKEQNAPALDNICGALSRLIITNHNIVPLGHVLPVFMSSLPLREDTGENDVVLKAFRVLYMNTRESILPHIEQMLGIILHVLFKQEFRDNDTNANAVSFMKEISIEYPQQFNSVANSSPEVFTFVQTL
ncbi:importin-4-like [Drosophila miranda]|uniref:importin-4-like n=1 Tax=Drosophila miranda TaxID=7229 RepID=UPI00143F8318|nr:importin-4-like [Drosophila miranda]